MIGLAIALLYATWMLLFGVPELGTINNSAIFIKSTHFLFIWYIVWTCIIGILPLGFAILMSIGGAVTAASMVKSKTSMLIMSLAGFSGGATIGLIPTLLFVIRRSLYIGGAYLFYKSGNPTIPFNEFDRTYVILGCILFGLIFIFKLKVSATANNKS